MAKKRSTPAMADKNSSPGTSFKYEVILWAVLALSIILFISNFGIAGKAGNFISSIFLACLALRRTYFRFCYLAERHLQLQTGIIRWQSLRKPLLLDFSFLSACF